MYCILLLITALIQNSKACNLNATEDDPERCPTIITSSGFTDDFAISNADVDGSDGWTILGGSNSTDVVTNANGTSPIHDQYHGDFSGANIYAQGTVNSLLNKFIHLINQPSSTNNIYTKTILLIVAESEITT